MGLGLKTMYRAEEPIKDMGIYIDEGLTWQSHIM